jgi:hypothetical protein
MLDNNMLATVGPLTIDIVEPFERIRVSLPPGDYPVAAELEWKACIRPI